MHSATACVADPAGVRLARSGRSSSSTNLAIISSPGCFKIPAETFSIGFGREIVGWTDKQGTRWKVAWLPLGGYVKFVGDMNAVKRARGRRQDSAASARTGVPASAGVAALPGRPCRANGEFPSRHPHLRRLFLAGRNAADQCGWSDQDRSRRRPKPASGRETGSFRWTAFPLRPSARLPAPSRCGPVRPSRSGSSAARRCAT